MPTNVQNVKENNMIDLQRQILKHGIPKENVFEFASNTVAKFERKVKAEEQKKMEALRVAKEFELDHLKSVTYKYYE